MQIGRVGLCALAIFALLGLIAAIPLFDDGDNDSENQTSGSGNEGDDDVLLNADDSSTLIETGSGNDTIIAPAETDAIIVSDATIEAGDGDDLIEGGRLGTTSVDAGDGNDTIRLDDAPSSTITGGAGDDYIQVGNASNGSLLIEGGDGNDTLMTRDDEQETFFSHGAHMSGGAGDDLIYVVGPSSSGAGFVESGHGGEGDDTIVMRSVLPSHDFEYVDNGPIWATGGEGDDTFVIESQDATLQDLGSLADLLEDPNSIIDERDGEAAFKMFEISDFASGVDQIIVDGDAVTEGGILASARLEEGVDSENNPLTELILVYESASQPTLQVIVSLEGATGVTWNDISFEGEQMPVLNSAMG